MLKLLEQTTSAAQTAEKFAEESPGDPVLKTTMYMGSKLRGRSVTSGISLPCEPGRMHNVKPSMSPFQSP
jgi:hypothetical protein